MGMHMANFAHKNTSIMYELEDYVPTLGNIFNSIKIVEIYIFF